jgi:predicted nucleotidyltransferase
MKTWSPWTHCARNGGKKSCAWQGGADSDLDLLVAWEPGRSLLDHAGLVQDLQELLGMKVHVGTEKSLHWYVRDRILREATPL